MNMQKLSETSESLINHLRENCFLRNIHWSDGRISKVIHYLKLPLNSSIFTNNTDLNFSLKEKHLWCYLLSHVICYILSDKKIFFDKIIINSKNMEKRCHKFTYFKLVFHFYTPWKLTKWKWLNCLRPVILFKKRLRHISFAVNFEKFSRKPFVLTRLGDCFCHIKSGFINFKFNSAIA